MSFPELTTATLSVEDIAAFSDAELAQFMEQHRRPNGGYELPVDGWDKLSKDQRNQLAERLKAQERTLAQSPAACSRPLDLDQLDALLREVSPGDSNISSRARPRIIERSTPPIDEEAMCRDHETEAYHNLVNDGGRSLYPIDLLEEVSRNPEKHHEMLWPWQFSLSLLEPSLAPWEVFGRQLRRWKDFRKWQNDNRGIEEDDGGFPAYIEWLKHFWKRYYTEDTMDGYAKWLAEIEADPSSLKSAWEREQWAQQRQRYYHREHGCDGFRDYIDAVKRRLAQHNFTRPFQLNKDPKQQDKLTTWIEYLNFEYWWFDRYTRSIERLKPDHDKAWQELVDLKVLRPHETQEFVRTTASSMQHATEREQAENAVERAKSEAEKVYTLTQKDPQRSRISKSKRISMLRAATAKLEAAKDRLQRIKRRNNLITTFIRGTFDYERAKKDAARHGILLQWILEQVPLIEAELIQTEANEDGSKSTKRRFTTDEDRSAKRNPKRQKLDHRELSSLSGSSAGVLAEARETRPEPRIVTDQDEAQGSRTKQSAARRSLRSVDASQAMSQGLRRSARIAARRNASGMALAPDTSLPGSRSRSQAKPAEVSRPRSSAEDTKASAAMKRGLKSSSRRGVAKPKGVSKRSQRRRG